MATKKDKPNGRKIDEVAIKYTYQHLPLQVPPQYLPKFEFLF
jgi:hypothetical protein